MSQPHRNVIDTIADFFPLRAAVADWRDTATLEAMTMLHGASSAAMVALDNRLDEIATIWAAASAADVVRNSVDAAMEERLRVEGDKWFDRHARLLRLIDARLERIALRMASMPYRPSLRIADDTVAPATRQFWRSARAMGVAVEEVITPIANRVVPTAVRRGSNGVLSRLSREVGARSGVRQHLRTAAERELSCRWTGLTTDPDAPPSYLTQLIAKIDETAMEARGLLQ